MGLFPATEKTALRIADSLDANGGGQTSGTDADRLFPATEKTFLRIADRVDEIFGGGAADLLGIVIDGKRPPMVVSAGQYVIVRGSTITGITDGLYTAVNALSPSTDVTAADLTAVSGGGLNDIAGRVFENLVFEPGVTTTEPSNCYYCISGNYVLVNLAGVSTDNNGSQVLAQNLPKALKRANYTALNAAIIFINWDSRKLESTGKFQHLYAFLIYPIA